jgi:crotonobetainyl-CoA:carnitine CoA-transferase CaiB-like acyl-CoA transferase
MTGLDALGLPLREVTAAAASVALDALATLFSSAPATEWETRLNEAGVPCAAARTTDEWFDSVAARRCGAIVVEDRRRRVGPMVR